MAFVMSPSNLSSYRQCPLKFYGMSIEKSIPWVDSPAKARGTAVHAMLEKAAHKGELDGMALDDKMDAEFIRQVIASINDMKAQGYTLHTEHEMSMTKDGKRADWWSATAFLRAKADVILLPPSDSGMPVLIGDWKTGRKWDNDGFQLRVETILAHVLYSNPVVQYAYWYVDQGETTEDTIDFSKGLADVQDIYELMSDLRRSLKDNYFPPKRNRFCPWCPLNGTAKCGV